MTAWAQLLLTLNWTHSSCFLALFGPTNSNRRVYASNLEVSARGVREREMTAIRGEFENLVTNESAHDQPSNATTLFFSVSLSLSLISMAIIWQEAPTKRTLRDRSTSRLWENGEMGIKNFKTYRKNGMGKGEWVGKVVNWGENDALHEA